MAKKKKDKESTIEDYYDLRVDKIDELVDALKSTEQPKEEQPEKVEVPAADNGETKGKKKSKQKDGERTQNPYHIDLLSKIPAWVKALFIKFWFAGVVCYFVNFGLGFYVRDPLDIAVLDGLILGVIVDMMVNPIFRFLESDEKEYDNYMMFPFPFKKFWTFFANIIYYLLVMLAVTGCYQGINMLVALIKGDVMTTVNVAVEPLLFGFICLAIDMAFIGVKDLIVFLVRRRKQKKEISEVTEDV